MTSFWQTLTRKKTIPATDGNSQLARVLTVLDLTALGVGSTLGLGVYVLAGAVAQKDAGPAVCLSFLVAAVASAMAGACYAEFASRVPKAGSAYIYSYVSVGEFIAYIIGWNLVLEYVIGTASVARGVSGYIDSLANHTMENTLTKLFPINVSFLSPYPDLFSFFIVLVLAALLSFGVKESTLLNNVFTGLNLLTVCIVLVAGSIKADPNNWKIPADQVPAGRGHGGFLPYGFAGVMAGAAKCFYGFVGFDCVATCGEEAKNPKKSIPLSIVISLLIIFFAYFGISTVLTLMWPYYDQDPNAPFPYVFDKVGWPAIKWIVTVGAIFALTTSLLGAMFPLPRILYAMAVDGLLFKCFAKIHSRTQTPLIATIISGLLAGIMAAMFDLQQLVDMMSIGTLLAYTIVAMCVLLLRYRETNEPSQRPSIDYKNPIESSSSKTVLTVLKHLFNLNMIKYPNKVTTLIANWCTVIFIVSTIVLCTLFKTGIDSLSNGQLDYLLPIIFVVLIILITMVIIGRQPVSDVDIVFKVPCVPLIPCLSIIFNVYLMLELDLHTWIRFGVWLIIGFVIYFCYSINHSQERVVPEQTNNKQQKSMTKKTDEVTKF